MSLHPREIPPVPEETQCVVRAAFPRGNIYMRLRDEMELQKTWRQVNAFESTVIPRYRNTIRYIEARLEEDEPEDIMHSKKVGER
jgi:hypothetical protein